MRTLGIYISALILIIMAACTKTLEYKPSYDGSQVVLNAQWHTTDAVHYVYLCRSRLSRVEDVEKGLKLKCYVNGALACEPETSWAVKSDDTFLSRCFPIRLDLSEGDVVTLTAESDSCDLSASAVVLPPPVFRVDTLSVPFTPGFLDRVYNIDVVLQDLSGMGNYYQAFSIQARAFDYRKKTDTSPYDTLYSYCLLDESDPLFNNSPLRLPEGIPLSETAMNRSHVFTDYLFNGGEYALHFSFNDHVFIFNGHSGYERVVPELIIRMASISKETYLYCSSSNSLNEVSGFGSFSEPVVFPDNVTGGIGNFGIYSIAEKHIITKEFITSSLCHLSAEGKIR